MGELAQMPGRERERSAWADPRFWAPIVIQLLFWTIAITAMLVTMRVTVDALRRDISDLTVEVKLLKTSMQTTVNEATQHTAEQRALTDRVAQLENFRETQERAYNFNFTTRLAVVEARSGVQPRKKDGD